MQYKYINCENPPHKMAYTEWGDRDNSNVLICVHGLTRNSRDFDFLAQKLAENYRVICPDIVGRGKSNCLEKAEGYIYDTYINDIFTLLKQLKINKVDWIGTSMGGLIGMFMAIRFDSPIKKLILNDIGAFISKEALRIIAKYILFGKRDFSDFTELLNEMKKNYSGFGKLSEKQWQHLAKYSVTKQEGKYILKYHPKIGYVFKSFPDLKDIELWEIWQQIKCPTLLLHGENSEILELKTINKMLEIKPDLKVFHISETAHAPSLMTNEQISIIQSWLLQK